MIYEFRSYDVFPGRLTDFLETVPKRVLPLMERCGFKLIGWWTVDIGEGNLWGKTHHLWEFRDLAHREECWKKLLDDAEMKKLLAEASWVSSMTNQIFTPTAFSPLR